MKYRTSSQTVNGVTSYLGEISEAGVDGTWRYINSTGTLQETPYIGTATRYTTSDEAKSYVQKYYAMLPSALTVVETGDLGK